MLLTTLLTILSLSFTTAKPHTPTNFIFQIPDFITSDGQALGSPALIGIDSFNFRIIDPQAANLTTANSSTACSASYYNATTPPSKTSPGSCDDTNWSWYFPYYQNYANFSLSVTHNYVDIKGCKVKNIGETGEVSWNKTIGSSNRCRGGYVCSLAYNSPSTPLIVPVTSKKGI